MLTPLANLTSNLSNRGKDLDFASTRTPKESEPFAMVSIYRQALQSTMSNQLEVTSAKFTTAAASHKTSVNNFLPKKLKWLDRVK